MMVLSNAPHRKKTRDGQHRFCTGELQASQQYSTLLRHQPGVLCRVLRYPDGVDSGGDAVDAVEQVGELDSEGGIGGDESPQSADRASQEQIALRRPTAE